jgi:chromosome segregation ATPase
MDAADTLYGVSMGGDGVSRVVSRKLGGRTIEEAAA